MSIAEQAQQLLALKEYVPFGGVEHLQGQLGHLQNSVGSIIGETEGANEIHAQINQVANMLNDISRGLAQISELLEQKAHYHAQ